MAALRMVRRCGVAVVAVPVMAPVVLAEERKEGPAAAAPAPASRMIRPTDLPIYEDPQDLLDFEYHGRERTSLEENIGVVRKEVQGAFEATRATRERASQIYETGKAHSMATFDYITDEDNVIPRAGAITIGGLAGLIIGARRRGGLVKKVLYTSTGIITAASLCYPRQAYQISQQLYANTKDYTTIGYNFVAGVKPQSKAPPAAAQPEKETPGLPPQPQEAPAPPPIDPEGGESGAALKQDGKDVIVTLQPQPEKDYGQSNPEDSDMYTTRG